MTVVVGAVVPAAPLLLSALAPSAGVELTDVRHAVRAAVHHVLGARPDRIDLVTRSRPGHLAGFGAPAAGTADPAAPGDNAALPEPGWAHQLGARLLTDEGWTGATRAVEPGDLSEVHESGAAVAVLVLADGSTTRGPRSPGGDDGRGEDVDRRIADAVRHDQTLGLTDAEAAAVGCFDLAAFRHFLAATGQAASPAEVYYEGAPFGVGYLVAVRPCSPRR